MGYLRFFLALLVLLSHMGVVIFGLNPGVFAVVIFYMLAGGVVSKLWSEVLPDKKGKLILFYKERLLRILPMYFYVAFLTLVFLLTTGYGSVYFTAYNIFANLTIIPLNFYMYQDPSLMSTNLEWWLIPPAWSLATELQAYILLPFLLASARLFWSAFFITFLIYLLANFSFLDSDFFGYRLVCGVLFIFLLGSLLNKKEERRKVFFFWLLLLVLYSYFYMTDTFQKTFTHETLLGLLIGLPLVYTLKIKKLKLPYDTFFGSLSYGIFLVHFLAIWITDYFQIVEKNTLSSYFVVAFISILFGHLGVLLIEKRFTSIRLKLSKK